jgi:acetyltransferase-like isoleucine patch superfamily enzyme
MIDQSAILEIGAVIGRIPHRGYTARDPGPPGETIIHAEALIGHYAIIYAGAEIGPRALIGDGASVREGCVIGARVRLGRNVTVNYETWVGDDTVILDGTHITGRCVIGKSCFIGPLVVTMNHREPRDGWVDREVQGPIIGDNVLIGGGAIILPGVRIGDNATIAAGAIVSRDVPAGATVRGEAAHILARRELAFNAGAGASSEVAMPAVTTRTDDDRRHVAPDLTRLAAIANPDEGAEG